MGKSINYDHCHFCRNPRLSFHHRRGRLQVLAVVCLPAGVRRVLNLLNFSNTLPQNRAFLTTHYVYRDILIDIGQLYLVERSGLCIMRLASVVPSLPENILSALSECGIKTDTELLFTSGSASDIFLKLYIFT